MVKKTVSFYLLTILEATWPKSKNYIFHEIFYNIFFVFWSRGIQLISINCKSKPQQNLDNVSGKAGKACYFFHGKHVYIKNFKNHMNNFILWKQSFPFS